MEGILAVRSGFTSGEHKKRFRVDWQRRQETLTHPVELAIMEELQNVHLGVRVWRVSHALRTNQHQSAYL